VKCVNGLARLYSKQPASTYTGKAVASWRLPLFRSGLALMAIEFGLYACGVIAVNVLEPLDAKLKTAAWLFAIGVLLSLIVLPLSLFGSGWKRLLLASVSMLSFLFWYGLTFY
jgi:uncharacterized membrane protein YcfT